MALTDRSRRLLARISYTGLHLDDDGNLPEGVTWPTVNALELRLLIDRGGSKWTITAAGRAALMEHVPRLLHKDVSRGYTVMPHQAASHEPEAVDQATVEAFAEENHARHLARQASLEDRFVTALATAKANNVDVRFQEAAIARRVAAIERKVQARIQTA